MVSELRWHIKEGHPKNTHNVTHQSNLKNTHKVEASSQKVTNTSRTRRSTIYIIHQGRLQSKKRILSYKGAYKKIHSKKDLHQVTSSKEEHFKSSLILQEVFIIKQVSLKKEIWRSSRSKKARLLQHKNYQVFVCPLLNISQCLFSRKETNWLELLISLHGRRGLIYFSRRMNF